MLRAGETAAPRKKKSGWPPVALSFLKSRYLTGSSRQLPELPVCMQVLVSAFGALVQVNPDSRVQVDEQPSPETVFPSSHCSPFSTFPFPQTVLQACVPQDPVVSRQTGSLVQVLEQPVPSPLKRPFGPVQPEGKVVKLVPQSQASPASTMPLPQIAMVHIPGAGAFAAVFGQVAPGSC